VADLGQSDFDPLYARFTEELLAQVRQETYGPDDLGQYSWTTKAELEMIGRSLGLENGDRLLDVACGAGGPARFVARAKGCAVVGVDNSESAIATATSLAGEDGLQDRVTFQVADAATPLLFGDSSFDALLCMDAIVLLPGRRAVVRDWVRLLRLGGRIAFTDPGVLTGVATLDELTLRASQIRNFSYSAPGENERFLKDAGLTLLHTEDSTASMEQQASAWVSSRSRHRAELEKIEGKEDYDVQQRFFEATHRLAVDRRQSRFTYIAERR
jgi:ubiquinone/menaquinone biosynthesis C-methylase UbiE